jgi:threonine/homoserine/homoserine lactone efflux protein
MIDPATPFPVLCGFAALFVVSALAWFTLVAQVAGLQRMRLAYARASRGIDRLCGVFFVALAAKLALGGLSRH